MYYLYIFRYVKDIVVLRETLHLPFFLESRYSSFGFYFFFIFFSFHIPDYTSISGVKLFLTFFRLINVSL